MCVFVNTTFLIALVCVCVCVSHLQQHRVKLNSQVALHQVYQYASNYYDGLSAP